MKSGRFACPARQHPTLTVTQADGSRKVITATTSAGWFTATYDPATKILVLKPRDVGEAM